MVPGEFSAEQIEHAHQVLQHAAIVIAKRAQDGVDPGARMASSDEQRVAILVKGFGSSSRDNVMDEIAEVFRAHDVTPCYYSYRGTQDASYSAIDSTRFPRGRLLALAATLTDIMDSFPRLTELYLVAHSFGGNVVAQWLCRLDPNDEILQKLRWLTLLASPINVDPTKFQIALDTRQGPAVVDVADYNGSYPGMLERKGIHVVIAERDNVVLPPLSQPPLDRLNSTQRQNVLTEPHVDAGHFDLPMSHETCVHVGAAI